MTEYNRQYNNEYKGVLGKQILDSYLEKIQCQNTVKWVPSNHIRPNLEKKIAVHLLPIGCYPYTNFGKNWSSHL